LRNWSYQESGDNQQVEEGASQSQQTPRRGAGLLTREPHQRRAVVILVPEQSVADDKLHSMRLQLKDSW
jgi:hypothetical protein